MFTRLHRILLGVVIIISIFFVVSSLSFSNRLAEGKQLSIYAIYSRDDSYSRSRLRREREVSSSFQSELLLTFLIADMEGTMVVTRRYVSYAMKLVSRC